MSGKFMMNGVEYLGGGSGGGGGNVDDVYVNGESVLDENKIAQVTSYKELTLAEYMALPDTKLTDGVMYCIKDIGGANQFPPLIYSTEEREVGVWIDGKPLYQKTYEVTNVVFGGVTNNNNLLLTPEIEVKHYEGYILRSNNRLDGFIKGFHNSLNNVTENQNISQMTIRKQSASPNNAIIQFSIASSLQPDFQKVIITIQYTKTTDAAGSGTWTTDGTYAKHYSTTEKVIGTWIDGKPLYERVITLVSTTFVSAGTWKTIYTDSFIGTIEQMIKCLYIVTGNGGVYDSMLYKPVGNDLQSYLLAGSFTFGSTNKFTLQYTKTTD